MSTTSPTGSTSQSENVLSLFKRALPVGKRRELLTILADFWRELLQSSECTVFCAMPQRDEFSAVYLKRGEAPEYRLIRSEEVKTKDGSHEWCVISQQIFSSHSQKSRTLSQGGTIVGGLVWNSEQSPTDDLLSTSILLIKQLHEVEQLQPNGIGVDWFNRRKQDALIEFAAGAGHEINNPVAAISGRVQLLLKEENDPTRRASLATIGAQAMRISQMIGDTMQYAEPPPLHLTKCELGTVVKTILEKLNSPLKEQGTQVKLTRPEESWITADETQLNTVIAELITNSMNALGQGGVITINMATPDASLAGFVRLEISDNGPGLSESDRRHLFDPFYSGRQAGRGLGFGLCKCWRIVSAHGGSVEVSSVPWVQTAITTYWPVA
ncbi:MAG: HAMP domain-containing sensor histidine kinase [Planctomycetaceae bacterium]|jgi:signal transduction histidine kinase|nr:HAMP domain-containing sensor histidine kinase [Planctomycetaceae bacterium]